MRHIREIKDLPISELTDEEIVKATMYRLNTKAVMLAYDDPERNRWVFLGHYKKDGRTMLTQLSRAWEEKFGKFKKMEEE